MFSSDIQSRFGTAIRARRKHLGYSQEELAERAAWKRIRSTQMPNLLEKYSAKEEK